MATDEDIIAFVGIVIVVLTILTFIVCGIIFLIAFKWPKSQEKRDKIQEVTGTIMGGIITVVGGLTGGSYLL